MSVMIRPAQTADAVAIAYILQTTMGESVNANHIARTIQQDDHLTFVAEDQEQIVGFVSGFLTLSARGERRWELDLLAVHEAFRQQGIGGNLVQIASSAAKDLGARLVRALVGSDNIPMHALMTRCGYQLLPDAQGLYVSGLESLTVAPTPTDTHLIPVQTLTYTGIWIEGRLSSEAISAAKLSRASYGWDIVGAVVPMAQAQWVELLVTSDFEFIGEYQWWMLRFLG